MASTHFSYYLFIICNPIYYIKFNTKYSNFILFSQIQQFYLNLYFQKILYINTQNNTYSISEEKLMNTHTRYQSKYTYGSSFDPFNSSPQSSIPNQILNYKSNVSYLPHSKTAPYFKSQPKCCCCCCCSLKYTTNCKDQKSYQTPIEITNALKCSMQENNQLIGKIQKLINITDQLKQKPIIKPILKDTEKSKKNKSKDQLIKTPQTQITRSKSSKVLKGILKENLNQNNKTRNETRHKKNKSKLSQRNKPQYHQFMNAFTEVYKDSEHRNYKHQKEHLVKTLKLQTKFRANLIGKIAVQNQIRKKCY